MLILFLKIFKMGGCSAVGCSSNSDDKTLSFHRLPSGKNEKEIARRKKWLIKMKREDIKPGQAVILCSNHFTKDDFERDLKVY